VSRTLVIADVPGHPELLEDALVHAAWCARRDDGTLADVHAPGDRCIQLGDLMNCVLGSERGDLRCLEIATDLGIELIVGNHEYPLLGGGAFSGFYPHASVRDAYSAVAASGHIKPCALAGGVLITHAGLAVDLLREDPENAVDAFSELCLAWSEDPDCPVFDLVGFRRGGRGRIGGVLWSDLQESKVHAFSQLFGHTPHDGPTLSVRKDGTWTACIDVGGKGGRVICYAWLNKDGSPPELVTLRDGVPV